MPEIPAHTRPFFSFFSLSLLGLRQVSRALKRRHRHMNCTREYHGRMLEYTMPFCTRYAKRVKTKLCVVNFDKFACFHRRYSYEQVGGVYDDCRYKSAYTTSKTAEHSKLNWESGKQHAHNKLRCNPYTAEQPWQRVTCYLLNLVLAAGKCFRFRLQFFVVR